MKLRELIDYAAAHNDGSSLRQYLVERSEHFATLLKVAEWILDGGHYSTTCICAGCKYARDALKPFAEE